MCFNVSMFSYIDNSIHVNRVNTQTIILISSLLDYEKF